MPLMHFILYELMNNYYQSYNIIFILIFTPLESYTHEKQPISTNIRNTLLEAFTYSITYKIIKYYKSVLMH